MTGGSETAGVPQHARYEYSSAADYTPEELSRMPVDYFNAEAPTYDAFDADVARRARYLGAVDSYVGSNVQAMPVCDSVLSFGCGTGRREVAIVASLERPPVVIGIEPASEMAKIAAGRGLTVLPALGAPGTPAPSSIDVVLCLYSFIHLPTSETRKAVMAALADLLKPGGLMFVDVFNLYDKHEWSSKLADGGVGEPPPIEGEHRGDVVYRRRGHAERSFMHYFTLGEISGLVESCGLVVVDVVGVGHGGHPGLVGVPLNEGCLLVTCTKR